MCVHVGMCLRISITGGYTKSISTVITLNMKLKTIGIHQTCTYSIILMDLAQVSMLNYTLGYLFMPHFVNCKMGM